MSGMLDSLKINGRNQLSRRLPTVEACALSTEANHTGYIKTISQLAKRLDLLLRSSTILEVKSSIIGALKYVTDIVHRAHIIMLCAAVWITALSKQQGLGR